MDIKYSEYTSVLYTVPFPLIDSLKKNSLNPFTIGLHTFGRFMLHALHAFIGPEASTIIREEKNCLDFQF